MTAICQMLRSSFPVARKVEVPGNNAAYTAQIIAFQRLPTEPVGTTTVIFSGVNSGSEIRIYLSDMTELAGIESCVDDQALAWDVYAFGSLNNTVRIVIVHPEYKIKEFSYLSQLGSQSIPVQQEHDKWYSNP